MRTKVYGEELTAETLENVTGGDFVSRPQTLPERLGWNKWLQSQVELACLAFSFCL